MELVEKGGKVVLNAFQSPCHIISHQTIGNFEA